jgi:hypothetical protein
MGMLIRIKVAIFGRAEAEGIGGKFWTAPAELAHLASEEFRLETHVSLDTMAPNIGKRARNSRNRGWSRQVHLFRSIKSVVSSHKYWESLNGDQEQMSVDRTEVCPKSPFHAKEFLPGGVPYDPNPRELFRGLTA